MNFRKILRRKPVKDLTANELLRRVFWRKIWLFIVFAVTYVVFTFLSSSYTVSFAVPLGMIVSPVLFYINLFIFRRYIQIEDLEITLEEEVKVEPLQQEDHIVRQAR